MTAPAVMPRTKKRCRLKKTAMGARIEKKPAAVSRCQLSLRLPASDAMACVSTMLSPEPRKIRATSRSFHTQRNWKIANEASAGVEIGMISFQKVWKCYAPSMLADSTRDLGRVAM